MPSVLQRLLYECSDGRNLVYCLFRGMVEQRHVGDLLELQSRILIVGGVEHLFRLRCRDLRSVGGLGFLRCLLCRHLQRGACIYNLFSMHPWCSSGQYRPVQLHGVRSWLHSAGHGFNKLHSLCRGPDFSRPLCH
jgi:hypothetical protein